MHVAVQLEFKADRKEPLGDLIRRVAAQFEAAGLEPTITASFSDGPSGLRVTSAVERALKKYPHLAALDRQDVPVPLVPNLPAVRRLSNIDSAAVFALADVTALADGVPRSLPFHAVHVVFAHAGFGTIVLPMGISPHAGVTIGDSWWVNGRMRSMTAFYSVEGAAASKTLPDPPPPIAAVLGGLGKTKSKAHFVAPEPAAPDAPADAASIPREARAIREVIQKYRKDMPATLERIGLPHDLPPASEARRASLGASGPLKPALVDAFAARGYDCRGGSGMFTLRRRTAANHIVDIELDVGTWSRSVTFMFSVRGPRFNATLIPPVTRRDASPQYPIGNTANWERIVANIATIVEELDRTFVPEIEGVADPAPAWFDPGR
jgi:hypothetical protein